MAALTAGVRAPDFTLTTTDGHAVSLQEALQLGPAVLVFFKVNCPTCQYSFPLLERMYRANKAANVSFIGISQNNVRDTKAFMKEFGVTFPVALDDPANYAVSNAYGLTNVPSIFYVDSDGEIDISCVGWSKPDVEQINERLAAQRQQAPAVLWQHNENIVDFRAG